MPDNQTMIEAVIQAKQDEFARNQFIAQYKPFIASFCCEFTHHYVSYGIDDELQVCLIAFNEAIDRFNLKGSFLLFSKMVMKTRLLDYYKTASYRESRLSSGLYDEEEKEINELTSEAVANYEVSYEQSIRVHEIEELNQVLATYGISFSDLVKCSPKHVLTRYAMNKALTIILANQEICEKTLKDGMLPSKEIEKICDLPRKKLDTYRKYIIAVIVINQGDYEYLKNYIPSSR